MADAHGSPSRRGGPGVTVLVALVVTSLVASVAALGAAIADDDTVSAAAAEGSADGTTIAPPPSAFSFGDTMAEGSEARDPALPAVTTPAGTVHEITLEATEEMVEIAPGVEQLMWTFGNEVPGPTLRGKVGDTFRITLKNVGDMSHSIDFHASKVAWNDEMRSIAKGEDLVYTFEAKHSGAFMYHCGTPPALHHIGMGMYGAIIIDPPDLPAVDHEYVFVQSELYRATDPYQAADFNRMLSEQWDAIVFNGFVNQYRDHPIRVEPGERVRAWVVNDGPSENSSWHVVGTVFDTMFKEGAYTLRPDASQGGAQALDLQPAQGGFVEFTFDEAGLYPFVTHKFANASKGALGLFQAGEVETEGGASH